MIPPLRTLTLFTRAAILVLAAAVFLIAAGPLQAQGETTGVSGGAGGRSVGVEAGADLVSSYVWRGFQYDTRPHIQPWAAITVGRWTVGAWGSYGLRGNEMEQDLWISVAGDLPVGSFTLTLFDYYFTEDFRDWTEWRGVRDGEPGGAHTLELMAEYVGPETLPLRLLVATTIHNDPKSSLYVEAGLDRQALGLDWDATVGALLRDGGYYEIGERGWTEFGLAASRALMEVAGRPLVAGANVVHNPLLGHTVFGLSLSF
jgi:hypothetical protein